MEEFNPSGLLLKIQKIRFKEAALPILLVFAGFAINFIRPLAFVKYMSLLGLIGYIFITIKYRVSKNFPPEEADVILSPVYGKITEIDKISGTVTILKGVFRYADYRCPASDHDPEFRIVSGTCSLFEADCTTPGRLIGILPLSARIECRIPDKYRIEVSSGTRVKAGETILASRV